MTMLWHYIVVEWKQLFRGRLWWALLAGVGGILYVATINDSYSGDIGWYSISISITFMPVVLLISQLLAISVARREIAEKTALWLGALPYRSWHWITARLFALMIPLGIVSLLPAGFYLVLALRGGLALSSMIDGLLVLSSFIIPTLLTVALGYWIGNWTRNRIVYLFGFIIVLGALNFIRLLISNILPVHWTHLLDIGLFDLKSTGFYSELWGFSADTTYWLHRLLFGVILILLWLMLVLRAMNKRKEPRGKRYIYPAIVLSVVMIVLCVYSYASVWNERIVGYEQSVAFYKIALRMENPPHSNKEIINRFLAGEDITPLSIEEVGLSFNFSQLSAEQRQRLHNALTEEHIEDLLIGQYYRALQARSYDLHAVIGNGHELSVKGAIQLYHDGDEAFDRFPMSLRHHFEISEVKVNGEAAAFEWEPYKDVFWVTPAAPIQPQSDMEFIIEYTGKVDEWHLRIAHDAADSYWERRIFVDQDRLFLPGYYGWYPYPGNDRVAEWESLLLGRSTRTIETDLLHESQPERLPADFRVEVEARAGMELVSNGDRIGRTRDQGRQKAIFQASQVSGFNLIGGDVSQWSDTTDPYALSITLSNQIPSAKAKKLANQLRQHYIELIRIAGLLAPDIHYPNEINIVRTDYPSRMDMSLSFADSAIERNGFVYLEFLRHPAAMLGGSVRVSAFNEQLIRGTLLTSNRISYDSNALRHYVTDTMTRYILLEVEDQEGQPLFDPDSYLISRRQHPIYIKISEIYESTGHAGFLEVLQEIYDYVQSYEVDDQKADTAPIHSNLNRMEADFLDFLSRIGGEQ